MSATFVFLAGLIVAFAYLPMTESGPSWPRSAIKTVPLLAFAGSAALAGAPPFLTAALFLSALGDFALSRRGDAAFLYGLSAFALAHLLYVLAFLGLSEAPLWTAFAAQPLLALGLALFALSSELWLIPHVGGLKWPVRAYILVIAAMGWAALTLPLGLVTLGAGAFIASDMFLAIGRFRMTGDHPLAGPTGWAVWTLYIAGQALILSGAAG